MSRIELASAETEKPFVKNEDLKWFFPYMREPMTKAEYEARKKKKRQ